MVQRKMNNLWKAALSLYFQWQSVSFPVTISDECHRERLARRRMCSDLSHPIGISCLWLSCFGSPSPRLQSHGWRQKQHRKTGASTNNQTLPFEAQSKEWWSESTANLRPLRSNFEELRRQTVCKTGCYILQEISSACDLMVILHRQKNQQSNPWDNLWISELVKIFTESLTETVRNDLHVQLQWYTEMWIKAREGMRRESCFRGTLSRLLKFRFSIKSMAKSLRFCWDRHAQPGVFAWVPKHPPVLSFFGNTPATHHISNVFSRNDLSQNFKQLWLDMPTVISALLLTRIQKLF